MLSSILASVGLFAAVAVAQTEYGQVRAILPFAMLIMF